MKKKHFFNPKARLLLQLGDQLIRNESIAVLELVKNSYDADSREALVTMEKVDVEGKGKIVIEDSGSGMDYETVTTVWMEPGSDYKKKLVEDENYVTPVYKRTPLGEKGIGRFAAHKLGNVVEMITRKKGKDEVYLKIKWDDFNQSKYMNEIPIEIIERKPEHFKNDQTGTLITVTGTKQWSRGMVRELHRALNSLCSPFKRPDDFEVLFDIDQKKWLEGLMSWEKIKSYSLFRFECDMEGSKITRFQYEFTPWPAMKKMEPRTVTEKNDHMKKVLNMVKAEMEGDKKVLKPIDLGKHKLGKVTFEGLIYDRDPSILKLGVSDKKGLKDYLSWNSGVRVYKDSVRVYDYGEPGNDWLGLDSRRVNEPAKRISNNIIISAVSLDRKKATALEEKTNREGFVVNDASIGLREAILYVMNHVENLRFTDKEKIREVYELKPKTERTFIEIDELRKIVDKRIEDTQLKKNIVSQIDKIENGYKEIRENFLRVASGSMSLSIVIHEMNNLVKEMIKSVNEEKDFDRTKELVNHLSGLIKGYSFILQKSQVEECDLKGVIEQALFNISFRIKAHNLTIVKDYQNTKLNTYCKCSKKLISATIINIIDNAIWWFNYDQKEDRKILITISEDIPGFLSIVIVDNGIGFTLSPEDMIKPFTSAKPDGIGIGLHLAQEVMSAHKGELLFPDWGDVEMDREFKDGAAIALAFRRGES